MKKQETTEVTMKLTDEIDDGVLSDVVGGDGDEGLALRVSEVERRASEAPMTKNPPPAKV